MEDARVVSPDRYDAVLFDMDGVITDTAQAHAAVWKRLFDDYLERRSVELGEEHRPFDPGRDYRKYVDGKPRYDGVRSFLRSRGIDLPWGSADDKPDAETVRALGNRKNAYFQVWLEQNEVRTFPGTLAFIERLRAAGIRTAVFSSSRNAPAVLRNASVLELFEAKVDGNDMAELGLPGKPDPAIMLETAHRLRVAPARTVVIEDAIAGVQAAVRGGFGLVVGVDRGDHGREFAAQGAHLVVRDVGELRVERRKPERSGRSGA